jgi:hypothetical protein
MECQALLDLGFLVGLACLHADGTAFFPVRSRRSDMAGIVYDLEGTLLEACSCGVLCPCWVGADPDGGECDSFNA